MLLWFKDLMHLSVATQEGLTPGNHRAFAPRHLQIIQLPRANILPQKATTVPPPGGIIWKDPRIVT